MEITDRDHELIDAAKEAITKLYKTGKHHVGAALRTDSGEILTAVNVDGYIGRVGICAESALLCRMIAEGKNNFTDIVAVYKPNIEHGETDPYVASPCGICRELLSDYCPNADVIYVEDGQIKKAKMIELLPGKFIRKVPKPAD